MDPYFILKFLKLTILNSHRYNSKKSSTFNGWIENYGQYSPDSLPKILLHVQVSYTIKTLRVKDGLWIRFKLSISLGPGSVT